MTTPAPETSSAGAATVRCPACDGAPALDVFRRYELLTAEPLRYCPRCYGFWAVGDALSLGVTDPGAARHPAVLAVQAPMRCRVCLAYLDARGACRKCGAQLPPYACPACGVTMARRTDGGVTLDSCSACSGTWFDVGEIAAVYGLAPPPTAMTKVYGELEPVDERDLIATALSLVARLFLPF